jgi:hypothetical protein
MSLQHVLRLPHQQYKRCNTCCSDIYLCVGDKATGGTEDEENAKRTPQLDDAFQHRERPENREIFYKPVNESVLVMRLNEERNTISLINSKGGWIWAL